MNNNLNDKVNQFLDAWHENGREQFERPTMNNQQALKDLQDAIALVRKVRYEGKLALENWTAYEYVGRVELALVERRERQFNRQQLMALTTDDSDCMPSPF